MTSSFSTNAPKNAAAPRTNSRPKFDRVGGEPDASTPSGGGGLKAKIPGKDDAAVSEVLDRELLATLKAYDDARQEVVIVRTSNAVSARELLEKHVKLLEGTRKELKDLDIMSEP